MNAKPINAPAHVALPLLVQYTRERRSAHESAITSTEATRRVYVSQYERLTEAMNHITVKAIRAGVDIDTLSWLVQVASDRQLMEIACDATTNDEVTAMIAKMRAPKAAPKAKAPKANGPVPEPRAARLRDCTTREQAEDLLREKGVTVACLRGIAKVIGLGAMSGLRKEEMIQKLLHFTIDLKLAHDAIRNAK